MQNPELHQQVPNSSRFLKVSGGIWMHYEVAHHGAVSNQFGESMQQS